ncbi:unnamed protein product [Paramecium pentaurelia]|uniref:Transmembrane protein n=1 Tax=Paramecium pentaurelia TaxID=43138 RepID=A0A8S1XP95_9CILI|nr:unnamed protein product [Paramecium pentaurelia]
MQRNHQFIILNIYIILIRLQLRLMIQVCRTQNFILKLQIFDQNLILTIIQILDYILTQNDESKEYFISLKLQKLYSIFRLTAVLGQNRLAGEDLTDVLILMYDNAQFNPNPQQKYILRNLTFKCLQKSSRYGYYRQFHKLNHSMIQ